LHEHAVTRAILTQVLEAAGAAGAARVSAVTLRVGQSSGIVPASVEFYFRLMSEQTIAAQARLEFHEVVPTIRCPRCGGLFSAPEDMCACNAGGEVIDGQGVVLESIEVD
jgi:hydrogenase nickel incorporation protein HypA/HybF